MKLTAQDWHARFTQQAAWTAALRPYLLGKLRLVESSRILEVGCGTGAVLAALQTPGRLYGIDINLEYLRLARARQESRENAPRARLASADALRLPFPGGVFDAVVCHFFLLWIDRPERALAEMVRVTRSRGAVIAFAEPDYGGRIDYPPELEGLGRMQAESLREQGAEPRMGRKLAELFHTAGLEGVETGVLGGQWSGISADGLEWSVLVADLAGKVGAQELESLRQADQAARQRGARVLFVPTFYAMGFKGDFSGKGLPNQ